MGGGPCLESRQLGSSWSMWRAQAGRLHSVAHSYRGYSCGQSPCRRAPSVSFLRAVRVRGGEQRLGLPLQASVSTEGGVRPS